MLLADNSVNVVDNDYVDDIVASKVYVRLWQTEGD